MISILKKYNRLGINLGLFLNKIPFEKRPFIGASYRKFKAYEIHFSNLPVREQKKEIFDRFFSVINYSYLNVKFYKEFYGEKGFHPNILKSFEDLSRVPIITKDILNQYSLEERSSYSRGEVVNTGGSSGNTLSLMINNEITGNEWAHMHKVWSSLKYNPKDLKVVFAGRSDVENYVQYDYLRNQLSVDIYADFELVTQKILKYARKYKLLFLHGYPSVIYTYARYLDDSGYKVKDVFPNLRGIFLGSEFPIPSFRNFIESYFGVRSISWYGHTERCVLAADYEERFVYKPMQSYGFIEVDNGKLIGTSYINTLTPLIRYDTGDKVQVIEAKEGLLKSFKISEGREGEFVIDKYGKEISLTALIHGRHHRLFDKVSSIQVRQIEKGKLEILYVPTLNFQNLDPESLFDKQNLNFDITFKKLREPIRTKSGKLKFLITQ